MSNQQLNALPGPDFLDAVADAESANGNQVNAHEYRLRAQQWREVEAALERVTLQLDAANDSLMRARATPNKSVVVYGPAGCGKTKFAAELAKYFGLARIVDGDAGLPAGGDIEPTDTLYLIQNRPPFADVSRRCLTFADAMHLAGLPNRGAHS